MKLIKVVEYKNGYRITRRIPENLMWHYTGGYNNFLKNIGKEEIKENWDQYNISKEPINSGCYTIQKNKKTGKIEKVDFLERLMNL